jgi:hypothetical protein
MKKSNVWPEIQNMQNILTTFATSIQNNTTEVH